MKSVKAVSTVLMSICISLSLLPSMQVRAEEASAGNITVTKTGLSAYSISMEGEGNYEGYGSFILVDETEKVQSILIDRFGNILFSSLSDEEGGYRYQVHDSVVSHGLGTYLYLSAAWQVYVGQPEPAYYSLDGSRLFDKVTVPAGTVLVTSNPEDPFEPDLSEAEQQRRFRSVQIRQENPLALTYNSTPMAGGYAVAYLISGEGPVFIDKTGTVTHVLNGPDDCNPETGEWRNYAGWFGDNGWVACFAQGRLLGYKDGSGQWMLNADDFAPGGISDALPFRDGLSVVQSFEKKWGAIDTGGNFVIPCMYDDLAYGSDGVFSAFLDGKWGFIDRNNQTLIPFVHHYAGEWGNGAGVVSVAQEGKGWVFGDKYGMVDRNNNLILPCEYDRLTGFVNGVAYGIKRADNPELPDEVYLITIGN